MNICCITIKYSKPDIFSELVAFGIECEKLGHKITYVFSEHCKWLVDNFCGKLEVEYVGKSFDIKSMAIDYIKSYTINRDNIKSIFKNNIFDVVFFGNMHPSNKLIGHLAKQYGCKEIWWWLHEPYRRSKKSYGWWKKYYYFIAELMQIPFLKIVDQVIVSSVEAKCAFSKHYPWYSGKVVECPLMLLDYSKYCKTSNPKYISFVGTAAKSKGIDQFFQLVEYASIKKPLLNFQIITSSNISKFVNNLNITAKNRLKIVSGDRISDIQLGKAIKNSIAILTPYRQTMQSGVVPAAYMHGVPIISTNVGSMAEFVQHGKTGLLVSVNATMDEWLNSIKIITQRKNMFGKNCRKYYENYHSPENWKKFIPQLIDTER